MKTSVYYYQYIQGLVLDYSTLVVQYAFNSKENCSEFHFMPEVTITSAISSHSQQPIDIFKNMIHGL